MSGERGLARIPALDGLRGVAVVGVLAFHAGAMPGGFLGVDLFFVLSGFLITALLLHEWRNDGKIRLGRFWERRARRLLPAALAVILVVSASASWLWRPDEIARIRADALASLAYLANWRAITAGSDYWALFQAPSPLHHMWSLAIEEQFYLVWPLVVIAALKWSRGSARAVLAVSLVVATLSAALAVILYRPEVGSARVYFGTDTRAAALGMGGALAALFASTPALSSSGSAPLGWRRALEVFGFLGAAWLVFTWMRWSGQSEALYTGGLAIGGLAAALVIAAASHPDPGPLARIFALAPLRWLGAVSYGLYLWHWPVFSIVTTERVGLHGAVLAAARVGVSLALAVVSYFGLERPIRRGAISGRIAWAVVPAAFVAVIGTVFVGTESGVVPPPSRGQVALGPMRPTSDVPAMRLLVAGDSVAVHLAEALQLVGPSSGVTVESAAIVACGILPGAQRIRLPDGTIAVRGACAEREGRWRSALEAAKPDVALLLLAGPTIGEAEVDGQWAHACEPSFDNVWSESLDRAADILGSRGAVVVIATVPYVDNGEDHDENRRRTACVNDTIRSVVARRPSAELVDLNAFVCPSRECRVGESGAPLRPDGTHFSGPGATPVAEWLLGALAELPLSDLREMARVP